MKKVKHLASLLIALTSFNSAATVVKFATSEGEFEVNLFDSATPKTVENFLSYVNQGAYDHSVFHRSVPGFIIQGGGLTYLGQDTILEPVPSLAPVINEPYYSNVRGTIAMAKLGGAPNSATNQWFFNLEDNSANLDTQNSGFTVFGVVMGDGMEVVDKLAQIQVYNKGGTFTSIPLYTDTADVESPTIDHFVTVESITVTDETTDTNLDLAPPLTADETTPDSSSGGGSSGLFSLLMLAAGRALFRSRVK